HQHDRDGREVPEVRDERREQVADALAGQQPLHLRRLRRDLVLRRSLRHRRADVGRLARTREVRLLGRDARRLDDLECRLHVEPVQALREDDDDPAQHQEQDRRVRHLVAGPLDPVQDPLEERLLGGGGRADRCCSAAHAALSLTAADSAKRPKNSASAATAFSNSSSRTRSFGAWMLANPSVVPTTSISASGAASGRALTSGIEPPDAKLTASLPHALARAARAAAYAGPDVVAANPWPVSAVCTVSVTPNGWRCWR